MSEDPSRSLTLLLKKWSHGDARAADEFVPQVYRELKKLARSQLRRERADHSLEVTALVHEAYVRLVDSDQQWHSRGHFFAAAAEAMRRILIEQARRKQALKRGGDGQRVDFSNIEPAVEGWNLDLLALDEALRKLEASDPPKAELVKLRFFAGLTIPQAAEAMGISSSTADNYWAYARCWLKVEMSSDG